MRILIIGGAGYIGGVTAHLAANSGHDVTIADNFSTGNTYNVAKNAKLIEADICNRLEAEQLFGLNYDVVMHFAARILVPESMQKPYDYFQINTFGALNVINAASINGIKNYILSSTAAVYGEPVSIPLQEDDPTKPVNPYGASKLLTEQILQSYQITYSLNWAALRYFNVAGAYEGVGTDYPFVSHIIPSLLNQMRKKQPVTINGKDFDTPDGTAVRDYVHVLDLARAHLLAAEKMAGGQEICQPINLGSHHGYSVLEVAETFNKVTNASLPIIYGPRRPGDPAKLVAGNARAKEILGWQPNLDLQKMISDHYEWFLKDSRKTQQVLQ